MWREIKKHFFLFYRYFKSYSKHVWKFIDYNFMKHFNSRRQGREIYDICRFQCSHLLPAIDSLTTMTCARYPYLFVLRRNDSSVNHGTMDSDARDRMQINGRAFPRVSLFSPLKYSIWDARTTTETRRVERIRRRLYTESNIILMRQSRESTVSTQ